MERPPQFGAWLLSKLGDESYTDLAAFVGVAPSTISRWVNGRSTPSRRGVARLVTYFKVPAAEIEAMLPEPAEDDAAGEGPPADAREFARQVAEELARINRGEERLLPVLSMGPGAPADAESWRDVVSTITHGQLKPIEVTGDCLWPRLMPGWIVWLNAEASPRHGSVVAIEMDDERSLREYEKRDGEVWLTARRNHPPLKYDPATVTILGVIQLVQHPP